LGKQRVEAKQINKALSGEYEKAWVNHPAVLMWKGYEVALCNYALCICNEWRSRGYNDNQLPYFNQERDKWVQKRGVVIPPWLTNEALFASHRSNLLRKDFSFYSQYGWTESSDLPYIWPSQL
jgi:hypothetical protein